MPPAEVSISTVACRERTFSACWLMEAISSWKNGARLIKIEDDLLKHLSIQAQRRMQSLEWIQPARNPAPAGTTGAVRSRLVVVNPPDRVIPTEAVLQAKGGT